MKTTLFLHFYFYIYLTAKQVMQLGYKWNCRKRCGTKLNGSRFIYSRSIIEVPGRGPIGRGMKEFLRGSEDVPERDRVVGYMGVCICQNSSRGMLKICAFCRMEIIPQNIYDIL